MNNFFRICNFCITGKTSNLTLNSIAHIRKNHQKTAKIRGPGSWLTSENQAGTPPSPPLLEGGWRLPSLSEGQASEDTALATDGGEVYWWLSTTEIQISCLKLLLWIDDSWPARLVLTQGDIRVRGETAGQLCVCALWLIFGVYCKYMYISICSMTECNITWCVLWLIWEAKRSTSYPQRWKKSRDYISHCNPPNIGTKITVLMRAFKRYVIWPDLIRLW